ncbi:carboxylesterase family protein [Streptomyces sp. VNUA116]|uniref:carboxylesterase/lipase family protein n=1 Tax=Streptomyces sp. VNUA116 TaxID=3062449 RepID=UPI00267512BB|nr:carboxylesterase family protein [Streptomyces sp. VNUA116]WKU43837.1 carboxylesterase family protein [Streptomyces sp. VNUA116]
MQHVRLPHRRGGALLALLLALLSVTSVTSAAAAAPPGPRPRTPDGPVVGTDHGPVRGRSHGTYATYEGIPYAAPPTGPLRWRAPQPARPWEGVRDAGAPGPKCLQLPVFGTGPATGSEDCLYLNVTTPAGRAPARGRPVMVWVHGGGFTGGSGGEYAAGRMAARGDAVVVTLNYRLGALGFFGHPELGDAPSFGLADQQAALRWVRANAARFGGDPRNVTLFGESAGAISTCAQLTSPTAAGLFHKAVLQSGSCNTAFPRGAVVPGTPGSGFFEPQKAVQAAGAAAAGRLGCPEGPGALDCLRGLSAEKLITPELSQAFGKPAYGNALLPEAPARALAAGRFHRVPVIQGTTSDEMRLFVGMNLGAYPLRDAHDYRARLTDSFGAAADAVGAEYPLSAYPTPALAWSALLTDATFACSAFRADKALAGRVPTYAYEFTDRDAPVVAGVPTVPGFPYGASHAFELAYLFTGFPLQKPLSEDQVALSDRMTDYWTRFARTGDPNAPGAPRWPLFRDRAPLVQSLAPGADGIRPVGFGAAHHCAFWEKQRQG